MSEPGAGSPRLVFTQGDPAGIGPEILLRVVAAAGSEAGGGVYRPILVAERAALEALRPVLPDAPWDRLVTVDPSSGSWPAPPAIAVVEPWLDAADPSAAAPRRIAFGEPGVADARSALHALDRGLELVRAGHGDALVTAPLGKAPIARHVDPSFRGHTDYLAQACGLERYGRDYLMTFLAPELRVALLTVHLPLRQAIDAVTGEAVGDALRCLHRHAGAPRIAVCGLNPHAGEGGLLGHEDAAVVAPAVAAARAEGIDAHGPESADSLFVRARRGEFDWVLALYHDQGLVAVKTIAFGSATNWTLGLPILRTSVDHGTAYGIAGRGIADPEPLRAVVATTLGLLAGGRGERRTLV